MSARRRDPPRISPRVKKVDRENSETSGPRPSPNRHCMVVHAYYPVGEPRVRRQAEKLVDAGYEVDVICLRDRGERARERHRGVEVHRLRVRRNKDTLTRQMVSYVRFFVLATARLTRLHLHHPYRTVQVHNLPDFLVFCALVPKLRGVPVILDLHDLMPEFFAGRFGSDGRRWLARLIRAQERASCRFADHVLTVSDHWRDALVERGVPKEKCSVVMNVADERIFGPQRDPVRTRRAFRLIYHGAITSRYGLDLAIRAVDLVRHDIPEIRLTILGTGDGVPALANLRRELGLEEHVELRDESLPMEHLPEVIAGADLGVVPYRDDVFTDALLPTKLMEYAAMELPSIASRTTAIAAYFRDSMVEFFRPGDTSDLARCIRDLHADAARRAALARASHTFTRRYNWTSIGADYASLVGRLPGREHVSRRR